MKGIRSFASDNNAGVHPSIMQAIMEADADHAVAYGDDHWTREAEESFRRVFGEDIEVFFVFLGTGANVLGLKALTRSHEAVVLSDHAHAHVDECGAPENFIGCKLLPLNSQHGKISPEAIAPLLHSRGFEHHSQPRVVSVTQATELGTLYTPQELKELADFAHANEMYLHMDGARLANAAAALGTGLKEITVDAGVDVLSFGGTKNGMMYGEAVVFFRTEAAQQFKYIRKQGMQLASKMRYISAQFTALLQDGLWKENAEKANRAARKLAQSLERFPQVEITRPVETNAVFARLPTEIIPALQERYFFYVWDAEQSEVRWMTSFQTTDADIEGFVAAVDEVIG